MNEPSPYQDSFFSYLKSRMDVSLDVVFDHDTSGMRERLGWTGLKSGYSHVFLRRPRFWNSIATAKRCCGRINIVNSLWGVPSFVPAWLLLGICSRRPIFIYSESSDPFKGRSTITKLAQYILVWIAVRCQCISVLAVGEMAAKQYRSMGFPWKRIFPFGYFLSLPCSGETQRRGAMRGRLLFLGQLIERERIDLLIEALEPLWKRFADLELTIIGAGSAEEELKVLAERSSARILFLAPVSSEKVRETFSEFDLLVLPSRYDGWGVVVNEALMCGVPVIVSSACGAQELVQDGVNGYVFKSGDLLNLRTCLEAFLSADEITRIGLIEGAIRSAEGFSLGPVVEYLFACIDHAGGLMERKPDPPWREVDHPSPTEA